MKLSYGETHLLRLIRNRNDKNTEGWTPVSNQVWPFVAKLPRQLCLIQETEDGRFAKLTHDGETVLDWC